MPVAKVSKPGEVEIAFFLRPQKETEFDSGSSWVMAQLLRWFYIARVKDQKRIGWLDPMLRRNNFARSASDGYSSLDPVDTGIIERLYKKQIREGEEALMLAVLDNAVECFQKYVLAQREREKRLFQEAEEWILEKDSDWFFSFENICETLQLYPDYIRQGLLCWKEAKLKNHSPQAQDGVRRKKAQPRGMVKTGT